MLMLVFYVYKTSLILHGLSNDCRVLTFQQICRIGYCPREIRDISTNHPFKILGSPWSHCANSTFTIFFIVTINNIIIAVVIFIFIYIIFIFLGDGNFSSWKRQRPLPSQRISQFTRARWKTGETKFANLIKNVK